MIKFYSVLHFATALEALKSKLHSELETKSPQYLIHKSHRFKSKLPQTLRSINQQCTRIPQSWKQQSSAPEQPPTPGKQGDVD